MYKDGLQQSLGIVKCPTYACHLDREMPGSVRILINERWAAVEQQIDDQRAGVLCQEHRCPADLWT